MSRLPSPVFGASTLSLVGQPIAVTEKPARRPGIVRFETNRSFTGMGHEHYHSLADATGPRPPDEIARRLLATGKVDGVHVYMNVITVDVKKGHDASGLSDVIEGLYTYWQPGMVPPDFEDVAADEPAAGAPAASGDAPADDAMSEAASAFPPRCSNAAASRERRQKQRPPRASRPTETTTRVPSPYGCMGRGSDSTTTTPAIGHGASRMPTVRRGSRSSVPRSLLRVIPRSRRHKAMRWPPPPS